MTKVGFISLGCSKNLVDTEVMLKNLHDAGFEITPNEEEAEIVVVNTCGFIESAKRESIDNILDIAWLKENGKCKHIIATGCLVERYRDEVMNELPELDAILGVGSLSDIADACRAVMKGEKYSSFRDKNTSPLGGDRILTTADHTAYLKIAEGCDNLCIRTLMQGHLEPTENVPWSSIFPQQIQKAGKMTKAFFMIKT